MKWFWRISYFFTVYSLFIVLSVFIPTSIFVEKHTTFFDIITINMVGFYPAMIIEWAQIPLCLMVIIFWKNQRNAKHFLYLALLVFLNIIKWVLWFLAVGAVT